MSLNEHQPAYRLRAYGRLPSWTLSTASNGSPVPVYASQVANAAQVERDQALAERDGAEAARAVLEASLERLQKEVELERAQQRQRAEAGRAALARSRQLVGKKPSAERRSPTPRSAQLADAEAERAVVDGEGPLASGGVAYGSNAATPSPNRGGRVGRGEARAGRSQHHRDKLLEDGFFSERPGSGEEAHKERPPRQSERCAGSNSGQRARRTKVNRAPSSEQDFDA